MADSKFLRVGVGGPVGSGKTALLTQLCKEMKDSYEMAVVTNDIYTREDDDFKLLGDCFQEIVDVRPLAHVDLRYI